MVDPSKYYGTSYLSSFFQEHLPPDRDYIVHNFEAKGEDFRAEFSFQILNEADGEAFVKDYFCHAKVKFIVRNKKRQNERSENVKVITKV